MRMGITGMKAAESVLIFLIAQGTCGPTGEQCQASTALQGLWCEIPFGAYEADRAVLLATSSHGYKLCRRVYFCCTSLIDSVVSPTSGKQQRRNLLTSQVLIN